MYSVIHLLNKWGQVYFREGISPVDVYEGVGKSVINIFSVKKGPLGIADAFLMPGCENVEKTLWFL